MRWKIVQDQGRYFVCRKTWHSPEWMGVEIKDIRMLPIHGGMHAFEVYAETATLELADKILRSRLLP